MIAELQLAQGADRDVDCGAPALEDGLVARARSGDSDAFHTIFQRYSGPVLGFIYHLLGNRTLAEELLQETFVRAYRRLPTIRDERLLTTWLFGIARNVAREAVKEKYRGLRHVALDSGLAVADGRVRPDAAMIGAEAEAEMSRALAGLKEDQRLVFVLKLLHEMSYEEIARITGSSIGKLKTDLHRARLEMRRKLAPYLRDRTSAAGGES